MFRKMYKEADYGELLPRGYGIAYRLPHKRLMVLYPIPLNVIIGAAMRLWWSLLFGVWVSRWERELEEATWQGFRRGIAEGEDRAKYTVTVGHSRGYSIE